MEEVGQVVKMCRGYGLQGKRLCAYGKPIKGKVQLRSHFYWFSTIVMRTMVSTMVRFYLSRHLPKGGWNQNGTSITLNRVARATHIHTRGDMATNRENYLGRQLAR